MSIQNNKAVAAGKALIVLIIASWVILIYMLIIGKNEDKNETSLIDYLKQENEQLQKQIQSFQDSIKSVNARIDGVVESERKLSEEQSEIKTNIKNLKPKYEKAASRSANFTADSIRRYFADL